MIAVARKSTTGSLMTEILTIQLLLVCCLFVCLFVCCFFADQLAGRLNSFLHIDSSPSDMVPGVVVQSGKGGVNRCIAHLCITIRRVEYIVCLFACCITSYQRASVSQGRIYLDNFTCCHTEIEVADQIFHLTQSQYTDTSPTSPSTHSIMPCDWQGSHWSANF